MLYLNDRTFRIFEMIEERGLQFVLPERWKPIYKEYLKQKKFNKLLFQVEEMLTDLRLELDDE